jgi:hypothetical protein
MWDHLWCDDLYQHPVAVQSMAVGWQAGQPGVPNTASFLDHLLLLKLGTNLYFWLLGKPSNSTLSSHVTGKPLCIWTGQGLSSLLGSSPLSLPTVSLLGPHTDPWIQPTISKMFRSQVLAHACNSSSLWGWDQEDHGSRPAGASSSWDPPPHLQNSCNKMDWRCGSVDCLLCKFGVNSHPSPTKIKKKKKCGKLGVVVHTCSPSTQEAEAEDCKFKASLGSSKTLSKIRLKA